MVNWRILVLAIIAGVCIGLLTGFVENRPADVTIPENKYYGFPFIWRRVDMFTGESYLLKELLLGTLFWIAISLIAVILVAKLAIHYRK